jgi:type IV pilus assembly protein PilY1
MRSLKTFSRSFAALVAGSLFGTFAALAPFGASAQIAQLADVPLAQAPATAVLPNLMYILDDSGSMNYNYMPDHIQTTSGGTTYRHCKVCPAPNTVAGAGGTSRSVDSVDSGSTRERITASGTHGGVVGSTVRFTSGTPPTPLALNTTYYIESVPSSTTFTLATTSGGTRINLTSTTNGANFTVDREEVVTTNNHGGSKDQAVVFTSGTPPAPFVLGTTYYILSVLDNRSFILSATVGGSPILPTSAGTNATLDVNGGTCAGPGGSGGGGTGQSCGNDSGTDANTHSTTSSAEYGELLFYTPLFNKIWYNPDISYAPAVDSAGVSLGNTTPTSASNDKFLGGATKDLTANFEEVIYCNTNSPSATDLTNTSKCRYQGKQNAAGGFFQYYKGSTATNEGYPNSVFFHKVRVTNSNPHYYTILPNEFCSDVNLTQCVLATTGVIPNTNAAPLRWCNTKADAVSNAVVTSASGSTPKCQKKFNAGQSYIYPRLGRMVRVDIVASTANYPKGTNAVRPDCAGASCTYAEELQNFANWWGYYRTRMALMKTSTGRAFLSIDDRYRVGFITINPNNPVTASKYLAVGQFTGTQRGNWYTKLYAQTTNGSTPLRQALSRIGRYYAGKTDGINAGMGADPLQYSCQTNYALLTTDGYWNQTSAAPGQTIGGATMGDVDNVDADYTKRIDGAFDGKLGASGTLADVAAYYYVNDLRDTGPLATDNVPTAGKDNKKEQHMVTFGLGLGLEGLMDYSPTYETDATGDFNSVRKGLKNCSWAPGAAVTCDWPVPVENQPSTLDDLWHAAVSGRGTYFSASDPNSLAQGLLSALAKLKVATAAAAASATSSPNITETSNFIFSSTFRTGIWDGEIVAQRIDLATGKVLPAIEWSAQTKLDARSTASTDSRLIYTIDEGGSNKRKDFKFGSLSATAAGTIAPEQPYFSNKCGALGQCVLLTTAQQALANAGANVVDYLRGQRQYETPVAPETTPVFRKRDHLLGDTVNATPIFVGPPDNGYIDTGYEAFKTAQASRTSVLYAAANDGMLHALNGDTGDELWAYVPRIVMPNLHKLANANWGATHRFNVDGSPSTSDAFIGGSWKTVLIAGLNSGGRGYYALDVTNPGSPVVLWEICSDASLCAIRDADIGFSYGNAEIGKRADGKWVAYITSGLNNVSPGTGQGFLFELDLQTGAVLNKIPTNTGSTTGPIGFSRISGFVDNPVKDRTITTIYGGDLFGNVYRFDTTVNPPTKSVLATLKDAAGKPQSITTRPELTFIRVKNAAGVTTASYPVVYVGTGRYLGLSDLVDPATLAAPDNVFAYNNSLYGIKDKGTGATYNNFRTANVVINTLTDVGSTRITSNNEVDWSVRDGWYVDLNPGNSTPGERINIDPQLIQGNLVVVGNIPNNGQCAVGGDAFAYFFDYRDGRAAGASGGNLQAGKKITGQTIVGFVAITGAGNPNGPGSDPNGNPEPGNLTCRIIFTLATGEKITMACETLGTGSPPRRTSWRELIQK